ncbi:LuxR family transcriptional regulator [Nocardia nova]|uniref:LuxR family transcriptional regulator n=2 Tax=Nocardia nova TaxID=37330 RepID=A0A2S6A1W4_9NOCA|nr:LuxR family transcriptional regulator [Nocardia nova]
MRHASWLSAADEEPFTEQMRDLCLQMIDVIGIESVVDVPQSSDAQLAGLRSRVVELINAPETTSQRRTEAYELLMSIHRLQQTEMDMALAKQLSSLSDIRDSIGELSALTPRELIYTVPQRVCHDLSLGRAMISTVSGSVWLPKHVHIEERTAGSAAFEQYMDGARIPLSDAPLETELLVRRRTPTLVPDPVSDKRTHKEIVGVAETRAYLAAPITLRNRTIAMLHADRPYHPDTLATDDLELLAAYAECLAVLFESARLQEQMARQVQRTADTCAEVIAALGKTGDTATLIPAEFGSPQPAARYADPGPVGMALTSREREVLAHLATGATNMQIARNLVVSEATVKSHLKQISRKLGTSSRAAAVAAYARMTQRSCGIA